MDAEPGGEDVRRHFRGTSPFGEGVRVYPDPFSNRWKRYELISVTAGKAVRLIGVGAGMVLRDPLSRVRETPTGVAELGQIAA